MINHMGLDNGGFPLKLMDGIESYSVLCQIRFGLIAVSFVLHILIVITNSTNIKRSGKRKGNHIQDDP